MGAVGAVPYGTDRNCLELCPLYRVYTGSVQKVPRALLNHKYFSKQRRRQLFCLSKQVWEFFGFHCLRRLLFL